MSSEAKATFTATLDTGGMKSGAAQGMSALDALRARVQTTQKSFDAIKGSMDRLKNAVSVQRFQAIPNELKKAEAEARKLEAKLKPLRENIDIGKQANLRPGDMQALVDAAAPLEAQLGGVIGKIKQLQGEFDGLKSDKTVQSFEDQEAQAKALESELAELQQQYLEIGGSVNDMGEKFKAPTSAADKFKEALSESGTPIGNIVKQFSALKAAGPAAAFIGIAVAIIAITTAAIRGAYALAKFALAAADVARNNARGRNAAAFGSSAGIKDIESAMGALRSKTALSKAEAQGLAVELYRAGDRGKQLEQTALTIERFGQLGDDAKSAVKGLYDELRKPTPAIGGGIARSMVVTKDMLPRDVFLDLARELGKDGNRALLQGFTADKEQIKGALANIGDKRFGDAAEEQMRSLDKLSERLSENMQGLFGGLKAGVLLGAMQKLVNLLDESSESGKAIKKVFETIGQPVADFVESALPYVEAFFEGLIAGGLMIAIMAIEAKNALSKLIPSSLTKNIDWLEVAFWAGIITVGLFTAAILTLAIVVASIMAPLIAVAAIALAVGAAFVMGLDYIVGWFDEVSEAFDGMDWADIATAIIDGIAGGLADGAGAVYDAMTKLGKGAYDAFKNAIKSKSPSVLFRMAGRTIPQGTALGVEDESDKVSDAVSSMTGPGDLSAPSGSAGKGKGGSVQVNISAGAVVIHGVKDADEMTGASFIRKVAQALTSMATQGAQPVEVPS
jgi:predicted  nucleic acid-binding Zn-ribbon protein